jgi:hypothetical protein
MYKIQYDNGCEQTIGKDVGGSLHCLFQGLTKMSWIKCGKPHITQAKTAGSCSRNRPQDLGIGNIKLFSGDIWDFLLRRPMILKLDVFEKCENVKWMQVDGSLVATGEKDDFHITREYL